jgi:DNA polymerase-3 subunit beta
MSDTNTNPSATIDLCALAAANIAASIEKSRYYLNGVLLEVATAHVTYVATDGHIMFCHRIDGSHDLTGSWIIPREIIARIKLTSRVRNFPYGVLTVVENGQLKLAYDGVSITFDAVAGTFPDWRRIVRSERFTGDEQYDPNLLARLWKAGEMISAAKPYLTRNGYGPAFVTYPGSSALGLIMPIRIDRPSRPVPGWLADDTQVPAAA